MGSSLSTTSSSSSVPSSIVSSSTSSNNSISSSSISNIYINTKNIQNNYNNLYQTKNKSIEHKKIISNINLTPKKNDELKTYSKLTYKIKDNNKYNYYLNYYNIKQIDENKAFNNEYNLTNNFDYFNKNLSIINNEKLPIFLSQNNIEQLKINDNQLFEVVNCDSNSYIYDNDILTESSGIESGLSACSNDSNKSIIIIKNNNNPINSTLQKISGWKLAKCAAAISNTILQSVKDLNNNETSNFKSLNKQQNDTCNSINIDKKFWSTAKNKTIKQQKHSNYLLNKKILNNNKLSVNLTNSSNNKKNNNENTKINLIDLNNNQKLTKTNLNDKQKLTETNLNNIKLNHQNFEINNNFEQTINLNYVNNSNTIDQKKFINLTYKQKYNEKKKFLLKKAQSYNFFTTNYTKLIEKKKNKNENTEMATYLNNKVIKKNFYHFNKFIIIFLF